MYNVNFHMTASANTKTFYFGPFDQSAILTADELSTKAAETKSVGIQVLWVFTMAAGMSVGYAQSWYNLVLHIL